MNKIKVIILLLFGFIWSSCEKKSQTDDTVKVVKEFNAYFDNTTVPILWKEDDRISVYDGSNTSVFGIVSGQGTETAVFKGELEDSEYYYALYPYSEAAYFQKGCISGSIREEQTDSDGKLVHAFAVAEGSDMVFRCVNSWIRVNLVNVDQGKDISRIKVSSESAHLAGGYDIRFATDDYSLVPSKAASTSVTLYVEETGDDSDFILSVFPGEYEDLIVSVLYDDDTFSQMHIQPFMLDAGAEHEVEVDCSSSEELDSIHDPFGIIETVKPDGSVLASYRNKYGMVVEEYEGGIRLLQREYALKSVLDNDIYSLDGVLDKYTYVPDRIHGSDYNQCTESRVTYVNRSGSELSIYSVIPQNVAGPTPFVVSIHGGGWHSGDPATFMKAESKFFASKGYAVFRIQYRLMDEVSSNREQLEDIADAVAYIRENAAGFNIDPDTYAYIGGSAGGQLALISGINDADCSAIVPLYAVYDVKGFYEFLTQIGQKTGYEKEALFFSMDTAEEFSELTPCMAVRSGMPPVLVIHGTGDSTAPYGFCEDFMDKMDKAGNSYETRIFDCYEHSFTGQGASSAYEDVQFTILDFFEKTLK